jgi:hypothetical protein
MPPLLKNKEKKLFKTHVGTFFLAKIFVKQSHFYEQVGWVVRK